MNTVVFRADLKDYDVVVSLAEIVADVVVGDTGSKSGRRQGIDFLDRFSVRVVSVEIDVDLSSIVDIS